MAQSGFTPIQLYRTTTASAAPSAGNLADGELAINTTDGLLFYKDSGGVVRAIASTASTTGVFTVGTVSAPGITFSGDTNTGIYSPAADTIAFTEGGVEAMRLDASGNVGIGVTAPTARLNVVDATSQDAVRITQTGTGNALVIEDSTNPDATPFVVNADGVVLAGLTTPRTTFTGGTVTPAVQIEQVTGGRLSVTRNSANAIAPDLMFGKTRGATLGAVDAVASGDTLGLISFQGADGTNLINGASISAAVDGTPGTNDMPGRLVFSTTADGASVPTGRMWITSAGNVGIGTSAPGSPLTVTNASADPLVALNATGTQNNAVAWLRSGVSHGAIYQENAGAFHIRNFTAQPSIFWTNNTERMRITEAGRVLVGLSSGISVAGSTAGIQTAAVAGFIDAMRFSADSPGPLFKLVKSRSATVGTNAAVLSGDAIGQIGFIGADGTSYIFGAAITGEVDGTPGTNDMPGRLVFSTTPDGSNTPIERMRIDNTGNVGIGTASPTARLDVSPSVRATGSGGSFAAINGGNVDGANIQLCRAGSGTQNAFLGQFQGSLFLKNLDSGFIAITTTTSDTERMRITAAGDVGIGTSAPLGRLDARGSTSYFSNSASAFVSLNHDGSNGAIVNNTGNLLLYSNGASSMVFHTNGAQRLVVGSAGQIGIGGTNYGTSGQVLTSNGSGAAPSWQTPGAATAPQLQEQLFTASGSWTAPTGVTRVYAVVIGGGGGGQGGVNSSCAGDNPPGGFGGAAVGTVTVTPGTTYTITIGGGGTGGVSGSQSGTSGGTSSFGALMSATGGAGGGGPGGANGSGSGGTLRNLNSRAAYISPFGGSSFRSGGTAPAAWSTSSSFPAGAGGNGGAPFSNASGAHGGIVYIQWVG